MKSLFYRKGFWIFAFIFATALSYFSYHFFPIAFPLVHIDLKINRTDALDIAEKLTKKMAIDPHSFWHAASFDTDALVQTFVELEGGGKQVFIEMIENNWYQP